MRSNQLVGRDGALGYLVNARQLAPSDPNVLDATNQLGILFQSNAQKALREDRLDDANRWLQNAIELDIDRTVIATMRADIDAARIGNQRADRARLLMLANQRIAQDRLVEPKGDSALHYLDMLRAADPQFEGLADTGALLAARAVTESRTALAEGNFDRAEALATAAANAGGQTAEVADLSSKIMSARVARTAPITAPVPKVVPEGQLRRTAFLTEVIDELGVANATVVRARAAEVSEVFDVVTARAVADLGKLGNWCLPLVRPGGVLLAFKGESASAEVTMWTEALRRSGAMDIVVTLYGDVETPTTVVEVSR